jgi:hypothetical protein
MSEQQQPTPEENCQLIEMIENDPAYAGFLQAILAVPMTVEEYVMSLG